MTQNPQKNITDIKQVDEKEEKPIQTVAKSLVKNQAKQKISLKEGKTYDALFKQIKTVISQFDNSIEDCKKYNEAKIHRKYQIRISDLETEVRILRQKLKQQQNARSPSKKYIQDLVDQLVMFKLQNQRLKQIIDQMNKSKQILEQKMQIFTTSLPQEQLKMQKVLISQKSARQTLNIEKAEKDMNIKLQILNFLNNQQKIRKINEQQKSKFQKFLKKKLQAFANNNFSQFLSQVNKWWISYQKDTEDKISTKLKSNVLSTLQNQIANKKLPKIATPYYIPTFSLNNNSNDLKKYQKKNEQYKYRQNHSTMQVIGGVRQKYVLK